MLSAEIKIVSDESDAIISSLRPEAARELPRTRVSIGKDGENGIVRIVAEDTTAMRAALNSYLGCIRIAENIEKITKVNK